MNNSEFQRSKLQFTQGLWPQKSINLNELLHVGENVYSIGGTEMAASSLFTDTYDRIIGIDKHQKKMVKDASGENGLTNYRNYINVASSIQKTKSVLVIASPINRELTDIIPIVDEYISPAMFFDFAEMIAEEMDYIMYDMKFNNVGKPCITITYTNPHSQPHLFGPGEDFLTDGLYLAWTPVQVELGHYYERLVCSNGQTISEEHKDAIVHKLSSNEIRRIINFIKGKGFFTNGIEQFGRMLTRASESRISLAEMGKAQKILIAEGVDKGQAEELIPYEGIRASYENAGYYDRSKEHLMKGEGTIWDAYNALTRFATHAPIWSPHDHRRISIMNGAVGMLKQEPDIVNYIDIY